MAQLQQCLQKFPAVQGLTPMDTGRRGGLRRGPPGRRAAAVAAAAGLALLAGCGSADAALSRQRATVNFRPDTTPAIIAAVRARLLGPAGAAPGAGPAVPGTGARRPRCAMTLSHASARRPGPAAARA